MRFTPKTEKEVNKFDLLAKGDYDFEVVKAENTFSKKTGAEMIKLELDVFSESGYRNRVFDYLLGSVEYKVKHFCDATALKPEYDAGELTADMCIGRSGRCSIGIQIDKAGQYQDKNIVKDYIPMGTPQTDDDLPPF